MLTWSLRSAAALGLLAFVARQPAPLSEALALAVAALVAAAVAVLPGRSHPRSA